MYNQFGQERLKLSQYVRQQLQLHSQNDAQILQHFRKQAEKFRKNKFHRNKQIESLPKIETYKPTHKSPPLIPQPPVYQSSSPPPILQTDKVKLYQDQPLNNNQQKLRKRLVKKKKELTIAKQEIKKLQQYIDNINKSHIYQKQYHRQQRINQMRQLIQNLSQKIIENRSILSQNLSTYNHQSNANKYQSNLVQSRFIPQPQKITKIHYQIPKLPSIHYSIPKQYQQ